MEVSVLPILTARPLLSRIVISVFLISALIVATTGFAQAEVNEGQKRVGQSSGGNCSVQKAHKNVGANKHNINNKEIWNSRMLNELKKHWQSPDAAYSTGNPSASLADHFSVAYPQVQKAIGQIMQLPDQNLQKLTQSGGTFGPGAYAQKPNPTTGGCTVDSPSRQKYW
jgi:hypothetical protein